MVLSIGEVIKTFQANIATLLWNIALWLIKSSHMTCTIQDQPEMCKLGRYLGISKAFDRGHYVAPNKYQSIGWLKLAN